jgi:hypothetical protein
MTIDDMADRLFHCDQLSDDTVNTIIAALRAAEEMRQAPIYDLKGDPTLMFIIPARRKWDAATGEAYPGTRSRDD